MGQVFHRLFHLAKMVTYRQHFGFELHILQLCQTFRFMNNLD